LTESQSAARNRHPSLAARLGRNRGDEQARSGPASRFFYADLTAQLANRRPQAARQSEREALIRAMGPLGCKSRLQACECASGQCPRRVQTLGRDRGGTRSPGRGGICKSPVSSSTCSAKILRTHPSHPLHQYSRRRLRRQAGKGTPCRTIRVFDARLSIVRLQIPIFDFGEVRVRQARSDLYAGRPIDCSRTGGQYALGRARGRLSRLSLRLRYRRAITSAKVLPLRKIISDETLLRYNAMLIDVFFTACGGAPAPLLRPSRRSRRKARLLARDG